MRVEKKGTTCLSQTHTFQLAKACRVSEVSLLNSKRSRFLRFFKHKQTKTRKKILSLLHFHNTPQ